MCVGMGMLEREHNDLNAATQYLLRSQELGEHTGLPQNRYRWHVAMARIREAQGDLDGALDLLDDAERLYVSDFFPNVRPVAASKTRVWVAQGRLAEALGWAREQGLSAEDELSYLHEFEHITLVRILLARYGSDRTDSAIHEAIGLLERLLAAAQEGGRMGSVIEILILEALAHQAQGDIFAALVPLQQALALAEPEGYIRMFLDEGPLMAGLLRKAATRGIMPGYTGKLLAAFEAQRQGSTNASPIPESPTSQSLIEPLSQRELEVLRLFKTELVWSGDRPRTHDRLEHGPHSYREYLQQTQRQDPPGGRQTGNRTGFDLAPQEHFRSPAQSQHLSAFRAGFLNPWHACQRLQRSPHQSVHVRNDISLHSFVYCNLVEAKQAVIPDVKL